jgi:hypothetical protein
MCLQPARGESESGSVRADEQRVDGGVKLIVLACLCVCLMLIGFVLLVEREEHIDLHSGRLRVRKRIGSVVLSEHIQITRFSACVARFDEGSREAEWRQVSERSLSSSISPHFRYHGTPHDLEAFMRLCDVYHPSPEALNRAVKHFAGLLRAEEPETIRDSVEDLARCWARGMSWPPSPHFSSPERTPLLFGQKRVFSLCRRTAQRGARLRRGELEGFSINGVSQGDKATADLPHIGQSPRRRTAGRTEAT